jgi:murein DD-endopeptidase MepM/ murein hydrolase activator NlpD
MAPLRAMLEKYREDFAPVVPFAPGSDRLLQLDFTQNNKDLTDQIVENTLLFSDYITRKLGEAGAKYGIGGYNEHRTLYNRSALFGVDETSSRRLHLGTDIWGEANTPVMLPLDGIVHSFAFNDAFGDYGTTIILEHMLEDVRFHTLYGHLSLDAIEHIKEGDSLKKGQPFASFGIAAENGHWPPHLHFQVIENIYEWKGDYPGVCAFSERETWLQNSPDPDLILQLNRFIE